MFAPAQGPPEMSPAGNDGELAIFKDIGQMTIKQILAQVSGRLMLTWGEC